MTNGPHAARRVLRRIPRTRAMHRALAIPRLRPNGPRSAKNARTVSRPGMANGPLPRSRGRAHFSRSGSEAETRLQGDPATRGGRRGHRGGGIHARPSLLRKDRSRQRPERAADQPQRRPGEDARMDRGADEARTVPGSVVREGGEAERHPRRGAGDEADAA